MRRTIKAGQAAAAALTSALLLATGSAAASRWSLFAVRDGATAVDREEQSAESRECPSDSLRLEIEPRRSGGPIQVVTTIPLSGVITKIPEFHDCQRFIVNRPGWQFRFWQKRPPVYDSLYAIFAAIRLDSLVADMSQGLDFVAVATIYTRGGNYAPLGIKDKFNCVYLWAKSPKQPWEARMLPTDTNENCPLKISRNQPGTKALYVNRTHLASFPNASDYPSTARWDWHAPTKKYLIGIKCGDAWCDIGSREDFPTSEPPAVAADMPVGEQRVRLVKGWHDHQWLATPDPQHPGKVVPTEVASTVIPDSELARRTVRDFQNGWIRVGTVNLPTGLAVYWKKLGLRRGANRLYLKDFGTKWRAMIISAAQDTVYRAVSRKDHTGLEAEMGIRIPATARWRWLAHDESIWTRCLEGCCQVIADE